MEYIDYDDDSLSAIASSMSGDKRRAAKYPDKIPAYKGKPLPRIIPVLDEPLTSEIAASLNPSPKSTKAADDDTTDTPPRSPDMDAKVKARSPDMDAKVKDKKEE